MSKQPKPASTAAEAITSIQNILRDFTGSEGLGIICDADSKSTFPCDHDIHKLSSTSLPRTQRNLLRSLEALKHSIVAREQWPDIVAERLLRVKADTAIKAHMTKASKTALSVCRHLALTQDPFASRSIRGVHKLQALAERSGAVIFRDDSVDPATGKQKCELTVSGQNFIAIFSFPDLTSTNQQSCNNKNDKQGGISVDVSFQFLSTSDLNPNANKNDMFVGSSFASLLRNERFDQIKHAFETLMQLEHLSESSSIRPLTKNNAINNNNSSGPNPTAASLSLCDVLRAFEETILEVHSIEKSACPNLFDLERATVGHGFVQRTALGLGIVFMPGYSAMLGAEPSAIVRQISTSKLSVIRRPRLPGNESSRQQSQQRQPKPSTAGTNLNSSSTTTMDRNQQGDKSLGPNGLVTKDQKEKEKQGIPMIEFGEGIMAVANVQFVLTLQRPVFVSLKIARLLERVAGGEDALNAALRAISTRGAPVRDIGSGRDANGGLNGNVTMGGRPGDTAGDRRGLWSNLQTLLAPHIFGGGEMDRELPTSRGKAKGLGVEHNEKLGSNEKAKHNSSKSHNVTNITYNNGSNVNNVMQTSGSSTDGTSGLKVNMKSKSKKLLVNERTHWSQTSTELVCAASLPHGRYIELSHNGGDAIPAVSLKRIPLRHPRDVHAVLSVLRQQVVFNELLGSCFRHPVSSSERNNGTALTRQAVEVAVSEAPESIQLVMFDAVMNDIVSIVISIGLGGVIRVAVKTSDGGRHLCSNEKATAAMRLTKSIPLTIQAVLQVGSNAAAVAAAASAPPPPP